MKNKLTCLILFICCCISIHAQRERNYVFLFDCTQSMKNPQSDIWEPTKQYLKNEIGRLPEKASVHVLPFQHVVYPAIQFQRSDFDWGKIEKDFETYIQNKTNTNICDAWDAGVNMVDENKDNYIVVLTDGNDNVKKMPALCQRIRKWCSSHKNTYVFYVLLKSSAKNKELEEAIRSCQDMYLIDASDKGIPVFGRFDKGMFYVNTLDFRPRLMSFSQSGEYEATVECDDPFFDVNLRGGCIKDGRAVFEVTPKFSVAELNSKLPADTYVFTVKVKSPDVTITNPEMQINVINKPERVLMLPEGEIDFGEAGCYDAFLWCKEKRPDTLTVSMGAEFNKAAQESRSEIRYRVVADELQPGDFQVLQGGELREDGVITLSARDLENEISIVLSDKLDDGKYYFSILPIVEETRNIDRINDLSVEEHSLGFRAELDRNYNPLAFALFWIGLTLLAALILWLAVFKPMMYPKFKVGGVQVVSPYYSMRKINRCRKVVFTSRSQSQPLLNRIFTGKVVYEINSEWIDEFALVPNKRGCKVLSNQSYMVSPYAQVLTKNMEYTVEHKKMVNKKIKIKIF